MLRVTDILPARETLVEGDFHIPLVIEWPTGREGYSFSLGLAGDDGGHIELDVDETSGSVRRFVVLTELPRDEALAESSAPTFEGHLVIDPELYAHAVSEFMKVTFRTRLRWRDLGDRYLVQMTPAPVSRYITAGDVRIGLSERNLLTTLSAPKPDRDKGLSI